MAATLLERCRWCDGPRRAINFTSWLECEHCDRGCLVKECPRCAVKLKDED